MTRIKRGYWHLAQPGKPVPIGPELDLAAPRGREHLAGSGIFERQQ